MGYISVSLLSWNSFLAVHYFGKWTIVTEYGYPLGIQSWLNITQLNDTKENNLDGLVNGFRKDILKNSTLSSPGFYDSML